MTRLDSDVPLLTNHASRASLLSHMKKYSLLGTDQVPEEWKQDEDNVLSGGLELWDQHQSDHPKSLSNAETDVESTDGAESAVTSSAVRMFTYVTSESGHRAGASPLARVITATENCGSFAAASQGGRKSEILVP